MERSKARKSKQFLRGSVAIYDQFHPWRLVTVEPSTQCGYHLPSVVTIYPVWLAGRVARYQILLRARVVEVWPKPNSPRPGPVASLPP